MKKLPLPLLASLLASVLLPACAVSRPAEVRHPESDLRAVNDRLDRLHTAASTAKMDAYFDCFAKDAVFLGTDATERWTREQFKDYCRPYFESGKGWTFVPHDRHVAFEAGASPKVAWFDELLENEKYGTCRGSGVLVLERVEGTSAVLWKVSQYNLAFMVPNDKAAEVTAITKAKP